MITEILISLIAHHPTVLKSVVIFMVTVVSVWVLLPSKLLQASLYAWEVVKVEQIAFYC